MIYQPYDRSKWQECRAQVTPILRDWLKTLLIVTVFAVFLNLFFPRYSVKGASMEGDLPLVIWKWPRRPAPASSDVILGFMTSNVDELVARVPAAGGRIIQSPKDDPEHGVRVGFVADVDGRLIEVVQMLAA